MLSHCLKCRKNTETKNPKATMISNGRKMLLPKFAVFDSIVCDKSGFISNKKQVAY